MKNYIKQYLLLLITIVVFAGLLLLKFSPGIDWGDTVLTRSLNFLLSLLLIFLGFAIVIIILGLIFMPIYERQEGQNIKKIITHKDPEIGKMYYDDCWSISQGFSLFNEEYRISVFFEYVGQDEDIAPNQRKAYKDFNLNREKLQRQLEQKLEEEDFSDMFVPSQLVISRLGIYKLIGEDRTSNDSGFEFLVTFDPLEIVLQKKFLKTLELNRDSVCAADNVFRHKAIIRIEQTDCNEEFILSISKNYLPKMDGATWDCIINDVLVAKVQGAFTSAEIITAFAFDINDCATKNKMHFKYHVFA